MTEATYTDRTLKNLVVRRKEKGAVVATDGTGHAASKEVLAVLNEGDSYLLEVKGSNRIAGIVVNGVWYNRKSDQQIEADDRRMIEENRERHNRMVEANREDWTKREAALPDWAKKLVESARQRSAEDGEDFETKYMGWGYLLIATELAVLYADLGDAVKDAKESLRYDDLPEHVRKFMDDNGISGHQDGWAWMIARAYLNNQL